MPDVCPANFECQNLPQSYTCQCRGGFKYEIKGKKKTGNALVSLLIVVVVVVVFNRTSLLSSVTEFKLKCTLPQNIFSLKLIFARVRNALRLFSRNPPQS